MNDRLQNLDRPCTYRDTWLDIDVTTTPREFALKLPWPLTADADTCPHKMIFEIDMVSSQKMTRGPAMLVRNDWKPEIEAFVEVFPDYVWQKVSPALARHMFAGHTLKNADNKVTFLQDEDLNWNGKWETEQSKRYSEIANNNIWALTSPFSKRGLRRLMMV